MDFGGSVGEHTEDWGPPGTHAPLVRDLHAMLARWPGFALVCEDESARRDRPTHHSRTGSHLFHGQEVYHFVRAPSQLTDVYSVIVLSRQAGPCGIGMVIERGEELAPDQDLSANDLQRLASPVLHVYVLAYDGDAFLPWKAPRLLEMLS